MTKRSVLKFTEVVKADPEMGILWGYASVADLLDLQGDVVPQDELVPAVYKFMEDYYAEQAVVKENHDQAAEVVIVESTFHFLAAKLRWYIGVRLLTDELRQAAKDGEISGFSIGGTADMVEEA